jgi:hypothetical protein
MVHEGVALLRKCRDDNANFEAIIARYDEVLSLKLDKTALVKLQKRI